MTNKEFAAKAVAVSKCKTLYCKGGFGITLTAKGKKRLIDAYKWNKDRADIINAASDDTFAFDCCGLVKAIIWEFRGDASLVYGGAKYKSNELKEDLNEKGLFNICINISDDLNAVEVGDFLYMPGHCGIYIGDGKVCESTPAGKNGVQITEIKSKKWKARGRLPFIIYEEKEKPLLVIPAFYLKQGSSGMNVYNLQKCLNYLGESLVLDGRFGPLTKEALKRFQKNYKLIPDGVYGPLSQKKLREVVG
ncbi:MAG: peptidoglycan-binding protein [Bacteroidales bacterium]|nr:peptidoglycan-binding protein [Bacteroidales bacterium]